MQTVPATAKTSAAAGAAATSSINTREKQCMAFLETSRKAGDQSHPPNPSIRTYHLVCGRFYVEHFAGITTVFLQESKKGRQATHNMWVMQKKSATSCVPRRVASFGGFLHQRH
ncbi:squalene synthase [Pseudozyma hubeiensis SY62]|uniref:Squalene synthase n=1 Tax=Pseudozyma hubeiensis (strain SY62) TaxID=1305764 RepID=R9NZS7_PSEHS|nr:squalene synthase [Pseudozyma hubeiensis SY62]GAC94311.1 squalene synthase [Pseudozyma hubeiensis SY62]